ncbi:MAG: 2-oxoglutarate oxidoreductase subunit KorB [Lentisphaerae bacterium ADurb.BinA184]|nr:MAG: 2-oxoglutarate oxidoreductase subunit KorB [Lentisphaerae bacterium ADurb.BinA184]
MADTERILEARGLYATFPRKGGSAPRATHYCAGCGHGILHKLIGEALADLGLQDRAVFISPVGCTVFGYYYFDCGNIQAAHGRAPAVGTGMRRVLPHAVIVCYQGDGDLASIGMNQTFQAANRGEGMAVLFVNNAVYGMTGGQMAPTSLLGQRTVTSPRGRDPANDGYPVHACEIINQLQAPVYIERCSLADAARVQKARQAVRKALRIQAENKGYAFVEFLSPCPTNMRSDSAATTAFLIEEMEKEFPLACFRDRSREAVPRTSPQPCFDRAALDALFSEGAAAATPAPTARGVLRVKVAGFGGQGVLSLGLMLARAATQAGCTATWFPSYGPEQRGGTANCSVVIADGPIGSPVVSTTDVLLALNRPSLERFVGDVVPGGKVFYDATVGDVTLPDSLEATAVPAFELATACSAAKAANTAMLGAVAACGLAGIPRDTFRAVVGHSFAGKPAVQVLNQRVFDAACDWIDTHPRRQDAAGR